MTKEELKQGIKTWWTDNKEKIIVGAKCLAAGAAIGFVKGAMTIAQINADTMNALISTIPYEPEDEDLSEWVQTHQEEVLKMQEELKESGDIQS